MVVDDKLRVYFSMRNERDRLGLSGSCVTGRIMSGEAGADGSVMGSRVPAGVHFDGLGGLALYRQVDGALELVRMQDRDHWHVLYHHVRFGQSFRELSGEIGVSETKCRDYFKSAMFALSILLRQQPAQNICAN